MFYADKSKERHGTQGRPNSTNNHPNQAQNRPGTTDGYPNQAQSHFYTGANQPNPQARFHTASRHPNRTKIAQTALSTAPIKPEWASQPHLIDLPIIRSNTFPEK